jgi:4-carboxymuconolactone decarboxylase
MRRASASLFGTSPLSAQSNLPDPARHVAVAEHDKLPDAKLATIVAGQRPPDLTRDEAVAYDVAAALTGGGVLPELTYRAAVDAFGVHGAAELCYLVGLYCLVSVTLNGFDVPVPEPEEGLV